MGLFSFSNYNINIDYLRDNIKTTKNMLGDGVKFCAVIKANAYGVGAKTVAKEIEDLVDCFAVANLEEGLELRNNGIAKNIIILGAINFDYINLYSQKFLTPTINSVSEMSKLSSEVKSPLQVEFALNSGMNRFGFDQKSKIKDAIALKNKNNLISIFGVFSHLSTKENDVNFMRQQKNVFDDLLSVFDSEIVVRHLSNTNASLNHKDFNYDMVRVGFGMYGMSEELKLKPVVSITSKIVHLNNVHTGEFIGYDKTFVAPKDMIVAVVPLGYFDGVCRGLSNKGRVIINGEYCPIVGRICMDCFMVDVTYVGCVNVGDQVIIIGEQNAKKITVKEHADLVGTSEYEIFSRFNNSRMNINVYKNL